MWETRSIKCFALLLEVLIELKTDDKKLQLPLINSCFRSELLFILRKLEENDFLLVQIEPNLSFLSFQLKWRWW